MNTPYYFDSEPFAERLAQVTTGNLTEDELKADFPEINYVKVGEKIGKGTVISIDKFMVKDRVVFQVSRTSETGITILKVAQFGDAPTPLEEFEAKSAKRNALVARLTEYQVDNVVLINPETFEPFEDTEEGRAARAEYLGAISENVRTLDTEISALRVLL